MSVSANFSVKGIFLRVALCMSQRFAPSLEMFVNVAMILKLLVILFMWVGRDVFSIKASKMKVTVFLCL